MCNPPFCFKIRLSKAEEIAEKLGEGWKVIDVSEEATEASKRLLNAIFGEERVRKSDRIRCKKEPQMAS